MSEKSNKLVRKLQQKYDDAVAARRKKEEEERWFKDRVEAIFSAPKFVTTDFWCDVCKKDCRGTGYRQVCTVREWGPTAWFIARCPVGHRMMRRITDKNKDPYYEQSRNLQRQRYEMADMMLTPEDPRFKLLYPEQYKALMEHNS